MKTRLTHLPQILLGSLSFLLAAVIAWQFPRSTELGENGETQVPIRKNARPSSAPSVAAQKLEPIRSAKTAAARLHATLALANSLSPDEIAAWLDDGYFSLGDGPEAGIFRQVLLERWQQLDPDGHLAWACKNDKSSSEPILKAWAQHDPQRLLSFYQSHPDELAELSALTDIAALHPALAFQRFQQMAAAGLSPNALRNSQDVFFQIAKKSPDTLTAALGSLSPALRKQAEIAMSGPRLAKDFSTEFHSLTEHPDGWENLVANLGENRDLRGKLFGELANFPSEWRAQLVDRGTAGDGGDSHKWLAADLSTYGFSTAQIKKIRSEAIEKLADSDPAMVFTMIDEVEEWSRKNVISNIVNNLSQDQTKCAAAIAHLKSDEDRAYANGIMTSKHFDFTSSESPSEWLAKMTRMGVNETTQYRFENLLDSAHPDKIKQLAEQFEQLPTEQKKHIAKALTHYDFTPSKSSSRFQGEVIRYALEQTSKDQDLKKLTSNSSAYAVHLSNQDPAAASAWVQTLPEGESKLWAQKNLSRNWNQYDPKATAQWIKTLPEAARVKITEYLEAAR